MKGNDELHKLVTFLTLVAAENNMAAGGADLFRSAAFPFLQGTSRNARKYSVFAFGGGSHEG
jgi:hypothetical protein